MPSRNSTAITSGPNVWPNFTMPPTNTNGRSTIMDPSPYNRQDSLDDAETTMMIQDNEGEGGAWDPDNACLDKWKVKDHGEQHAPTQRLQDLTLGLGNSNHQSKNSSNHSTSWPYDSSPCRWNGGKNTRPGTESTALNQQLFTTEFLRNKDAMDVEDMVGEETDPQQLPKQRKERSNHSDVAMEDEDNDVADNHSDGSSEIDSETSTEFADDDDDDDHNINIVEEEEDDDDSDGSFGEEEDEDLPPSKNQVRVSSSSSNTRNAISNSTARNDRQAQEHSNEKSHSHRSSDIEPHRATQDGSDRLRSSSSNGSARQHHHQVNKRLSSSQHQPRSSLKEEDYTDAKRRSSPSKHYNNMLAYYKPDGRQNTSTSEVGQSSDGAVGGNSTRSGTSERCKRSSSMEKRSAGSRSRDALSASCHGQVERKTSSSQHRSSVSSSSRRQSDELSSSTFHGPVSQSRTGPSSLSMTTGPTSSSVSSSSRRVPPARTRSSDGAELGAATLHGGSSVSRIRSGKRRPTTSSSTDSKGSSRDGTGSKSGSTRPTKPGERRMLQRAMSIRNVKRPEEYAVGHGGAAASASSSAAGDVASTTTRTGAQPDRVKRPEIGMGGGGNSRPTSSRSSMMQRSSSVRNVSSTSSSSFRTREAMVEQRTSENAAGTANQGGEIKTSSRSSSSRPISHRTTQKSLSRSDSVDSSTNVIATGSMSSMSTTSTSSGTWRRGVATPSAPSTMEQQQQEIPRSRDLLLLLRDQKKVTQHDLMDKENRRLLHFLMIEHKMGVSQQELYHAIRAERSAAEMAT